MDTSQISRLDELDHLLLQCEEASVEDAPYRAARDALRAHLRDSCRNLSQSDDEPSLSKIIDHISDHESRELQRETSLLLIRALGLGKVLPENNPYNQLHAKICSLSQQSCPDILKRFKIRAADQTHQTIASLSAIHDNLLQPLRQLVNVEPDIAAIRADIQSFRKFIGDATNKAYFQPWRLEHYASRIRQTLDEVERIEKADPDAMCDIVDRLETDLVSQIRSLQSARNGLISTAYLQFASVVHRAVSRHLEAHTASFDCRLQLSAERLEKRFPLKAGAGKLRVSINAQNTGPGRAYDVKIMLVSQQNGVLIEPGEIQLGTVDPGSFVIPASLELSETLAEIRIDLVVSWRIAGKSTPTEVESTLTILAQSGDVEWDKLELTQPYGLDVATGKGFVGRRESLHRILARMRTPSMQPCYITGQKRVGKTSLAHAVADSLESDTHYRYFVVSLETGEFAHPNGADTLRALGEEIEARVVTQLPSSVQWPRADFNGSLAPLSRLFHMVEQHCPGLRVVIILDEFDDINYDLYRHGPLADTFFQNIRTLSSRPNLSFVLVGGERMPFLMSAQGEKLNRFERESLDRFDQTKDWDEYEQLIRHPVEGAIRWHDSAVRRVYAEANGHPYFTKLLCATVFSRCVRHRDSEVIEEDVERALTELVQTLDVNAFAHYWKDGVQGGADLVEITSLKRCRVLAAYARTRRAKRPAISQSIAEYMYSRQVSYAEMETFLREFCRRRVMEERDGEFRIVVPIFERWLVERGVNDLIADQLGDELEEIRRRQDDQAYVKSAEIQEVISVWPTFRSRAVTSEDVRSWLCQVSGNIQQRRLFKILQNTRFVTEKEIREKFRSMHTSVLRNIPPVVRRHKSDRRQDILVTYLAGPGKSGVKYANLYAEENIIATSCVVDIEQLETRINVEAGVDDIHAVLIIDDLAASGNTLVTELKEFFGRHRTFLEERGIHVFVVVAVATPEGEAAIRNAMRKLGYERCDLRVCEFLDPRHTCFPEGLGFWESAEEKLEAKALCLELGQRLRPKDPLGYHGQALLLVFPHNCPNNSLPILFAQGESWRPLFPRKP